MRKLLILMALCLGFGGTAMAAGNVLLPSTSNGTRSLPNLGLTPRQAPETSDNTPTSKPEPKAAPKPVLPSLHAASKTPQYTPAPALTGNRPLIPFPTYPTKIVQIQPEASLPNPNAANLPYSMSVEIADKYSWGPKDLADINRRLGIAADKVASLCHLSISGDLKSDAGIYPFNAAGSARAQIKYAGRVSGARVMVRALCDRVNLPANRGIVLQLGDQYAVMLRNIECPLPSSQVAPGQLVFRYAGNGAGQCIFK